MILRSFALVSFLPFSISFRLSSSQRYLIEFRDTFPLFRFNELEEICNQIASSSANHKGTLNEEYFNYKLVVYDATGTGRLVCVYANFPSEEFAIKVTQRSCLIRSIVEVFGDGVTPDETCSQALSNIDQIINPTRFNTTSSPATDNTWKVAFRRYGRTGKSGLDYEGKRLLLENFRPVLSQLPGVVNLVDPKHNYIYLEDWSDYHTVSHLKKHAYNSPLNVPSSSSTPDADSSSPTESMIFTPSRCIFGRIIAEGPSIGHNYDLKYRPFIGTTTMDPMSAHLSAVAADIKEGDLVLDPYCGTGSLLIACAHLGARVIGSDFDCYNFGLAVPNDYIPPPNTESPTPTPTPTTTDRVRHVQPLSAIETHSTLATTPYIEPKQPTTVSSSVSKREKALTQTKLGNAIFKRKTLYDQSNKNIYHNFVYYNMTSNCIALLNMDSYDWLPVEKGHNYDLSRTLKPLPMKLLTNNVTERVVYDVFDMNYVLNKCTKIEMMGSGNGNSSTNSSAYNQQVYTLTELKLVKKVRYLCVFITCVYICTLLTFYYFPYMRDIYIHVYILLNICAICRYIC